MWFYFIVWNPHWEHDLEFVIMTTHLWKYEKFFKTMVYHLFISIPLNLIASVTLIQMTSFTLEILSVFYHACVYLMMIKVLKIQECQLIFDIEFHQTNRCFGQNEKLNKLHASVDVTLIVWSTNIAWSFSLCCQFFFIIIKSL